MNIQFVSRHLLFFVSYLKASENKLENALFFKSMKEGVGEYNATSLVTVDITPEMFIKTINLVTNERHGLCNTILAEAMKGIGAPAGYVSIEAQLSALVADTSHPDNAEAVEAATALAQTRANFAASLENDYVQSTLTWLNSLSF